MTQSIGVNLISGLLHKRAGLSGEYKAAQKALEAMKADMDAIDRTLALCGYKGDPRGIEPRGKYKTMFGRNELKLLIMAQLKQGLKDDRELVAGIVEAKKWDADSDLTAEILKRVRHALQRLRNTGRIEQSFGPDGALWKVK